jgi:hypothetical protein
MAVYAQDRVLRGRRSAHDIVNEISVAAKTALLRIAALCGLIWIGSWKSWNVKPFEWWYPFSAFAKYLRTKVWGRWQSTQVACAWCGPFVHDAYSSFMMWQFLHARGSVEK